MGETLDLPHFTTNTASAVEMHCSAGEILMQGGWVESEWIANAVEVAVQ